MKLEVLDKDYIYHIYNRGINGETIFFNDENKKYFLHLIDKYLHNKCDVYAYCLMDNHFHILFTVTCENDIVTQGLSNMFNAYAKAFNKSNNRTGSLFEKHFKRIRITDEHYLRKLIVYIHLNPKHHFDIDFTNFKYSSYKSFLTDRETKLKRNYVLELFGGKENFVFLHQQKNDILNDQLALE